MILRVFSQKRKTRLRDEGLTATVTQLKSGRARLGIQKPLAINQVASIASCGAGVPELLTADPAVPRVRQRAKIHMSRKQKQA